MLLINFLFYSDGRTDGNYKNFEVGINALNGVILCPINSVKLLIVNNLQKVF
jgi:hypothetical protein